MSKNTFVIATRGHAAHLLALALKKLGRLEAEVVEQKTLVADLEAKRDSLPESVAPAPRAKKVYTVGQTLRFFFGRTVTRTELVGVVDAVSPDGGKLLMVVGEGFGKKQYEIFVGAVKAVISADGAEEQVEQAQEDGQEPAGEPAVAPEGDAQPTAGDGAVDVAFDADPLA